MVGFQTIMIVALMVGLAFWANNWFLYLIALVSLVFFGLYWYGTSETPMGMEISFASWALAAFCLYKIIDTAPRGKG